MIGIGPKITWAIARFLESMKHRVDPPGGGVHVQLDHGFKGRKRHRSPRGVDTIVVHQTGIEFGVSARQVRKFGGERHAYHARFASTPYHVVVLRNGDVLLNNAYKRYTYHGGSLNRDSIGFAIEGRLPHVESDRTDAHTEVTLPRLAAWRWGLTWAIGHAREHACPIRRIVAHRQGDATKPADPGELIWSQVVEVVAKQQGVDIEPQWTRGTGQPIPPEWRWDVGGAA